jgi:thiol-disulfide isomerase/thioredoxin
MLEEVLARDFGGSLGSPTHWLQLTSGGRLGVAVERFEEEFVTGHHPLYGRCRIPAAQIHTIRNTPLPPSRVTESVGDWQLVYAPEPVLPETGGQTSTLIGTEAKPFKLPLLAGGEFELAKEQGKVVVLDFWASWCGPCIKAIPVLLQTMAGFPEEKVKFIGVNQSEPAEQVKRFIEARGWQFTVALDAGQNVARQYGVQGIPHTVVVAPDGRVAWVKTGFGPNVEKELAEAVQRLLEPEAK